MKTLAGIVVGIWMVGAVLMSGYYVISDRIVCIQEDGIAGFIWCEKTGPVSSYHFMTFMKGAFWPLYLGRYAVSLVDDENSASATTNVYKGLVSENKGAFICAEMIKNANSDGRVYSRINRVIFEENKNNRIRLRQIATEYYGHVPTTQELRQYRDESIRLSIAACMFNPDWTVERAIFVGAKGVVPGKFKEGSDSTPRQSQSNLSDSDLTQFKNDASTRMCEVISEYARDVMIRRQNGASISDIAERLGRICTRTNSCDTPVVKMVALITANAFEVPVRDDKLMAQITVDHFANKWRDQCLTANRK